MSAVVELHQVWRRFQRGESAVEALVDVTLTLAPGEYATLVGPSGGGKSTLLNLISGVDRADKGRVVVCGVDLARATEADLVRLRRHQLGLVFQSFYLVPHLTVEENVALPLALAGTSDPDRVSRLLERVGIAHRRAHYPGELSGGEQQRTAVARALVHRPRLLLADEPTGNLDSHSGAQVLELMESLRAEEGAALLLVTHDPDVAARGVTRLLLRDGRLSRSTNGSRP